MRHLLSLMLGMAALLAAAQPALAEILGPDAAACRPGSGRDALLLTVNGFKSREGTLRVELWPGTEADFMRDHHQLVAEGKAYHRVTVPVPASGPARVCVPLPGPGTYAVGAFHSPSGVRKFNFRTDGATFTRNPRVGISRPKAADVAMTFGPGLNESAVTMNYLRGLGFRPIPQSELETAQR
ncbi:MAG: DUF2141 domain-containing protein [Sphingomonadaceae bacterium]